MSVVNDSIRWPLHDAGWPLSRESHFDLMLSGPPEQPRRCRSSMPSLCGPAAPASRRQEVLMTYQKALDESLDLERKLLYTLSSAHASCANRAAVVLAAISERASAAASRRARRGSRAKLEPQR